MPGNLKPKAAAAEADDWYTVQILNCMALFINDINLFYIKC